MRVSAFCSTLFSASVISAFVASATVLSSGCSSPDGSTVGGVAAADVVLTADATTDYGSITLGSSLDKTFTVLNQGAGDATLATITTAGLGLNGPFTLDASASAASPCQTGTVLHGGKSETCTLTVKFAPTATIKTYTDLVVQYTDATQTTTQSNPIQWELVGTGIPVPVPAAHVTITSTMAANFGNVAIGNTAELTFTVLLAPWETLRMRAWVFPRHSRSHPAAPA